MTDQKNTNLPQQSVSFAKGLFLGSLYQNQIFPYPEMKKGELETLTLVLDSIDKFMAGYSEQYREFDKKGEQPADYIEKLKELGLFGLIIPEEHGGLGFSNAAYSRAIQQSSRIDASTSLTIGAHSSIGMKGLLLFGTEEQKAKYLPKLASGEMVAAFCLTEPGSGSDAASIKTSAKKESDGSWTLNGEKIWITNGAFAEFFTVFAKTDSPDGKLSAFIVEREFGGVTNGPKEDKMGIRASATTTVSFNNTKIPAANLLGEEGKGFKVAMSILNNGRTGLGGGCVGAMKKMIELATKQSQDRKQFGKKISEFGLIKEKLSAMALQCFAAESAVHLVASLIDRGSEDYSVEAAMSKVFASEALWFVANEALQIAGGNGFMKEYPYERVVRDSRINMIFEGTNDILRLYIALSGLKDAGETLKEIGKNASSIFNDPIKGFGVLGGYAAKKFSQLTPIGRDRFQDISPALEDAALILENYTARFGGAVEQALKRYRSAIVDNQLVTKRIGEIAIDLFIGTAVVSRVNKLLESKGVGGCSVELAIANTFVTQAKRRMSLNFRRLEKNEDDAVECISNHILNSGGYSWDIF